MTKTNVQLTPSNSQHHDTPNNKTHVIKFRVTAEEKASLELTCKLLNLSLSTFIRRAMINLKIDPEFQNQIPPLTDDEYKQLEENILKEGKLLSPLIVWNNTLVDGHNRYAILQKHPEIYFSTMPLRFENREEAVAWICKNQLGRRNLTPEQKYYLMGKQYEAEKAGSRVCAAGIRKGKVL